MGCTVLQRDARNVTERVGMSANTPKGGRERGGRERKERERGMAGLRGERTILRQPQPTLHYTASLEEDTVGLKEAAQGWNRR